MVVAMVVSNGVASYPNSKQFPGKGPTKVVPLCRSDRQQLGWFQVLLYRRDNVSL